MSATLIARFAAFIAERQPFALKAALAALEEAIDGRELDEHDPAAIDSLREPLKRALEPALANALTPATVVTNVPETTPGISVNQRLHQAVASVLDDCEGFLRREAIGASLTADERRAILRGMILTRAVDNRLKSFFTGGEVRWGNTSFQGKGFRSLGQEAIYAAAIRLRKGSEEHDVISPMIRDLGAVLAMHDAPETVRMVLSAQMGKAGPPMNGRDLHVGDWAHGIYPAMAPLGSPALTMAGVAMAFALDGHQRVAVSFVGEGSTSLGEWHEAINACAARRLPAVFCVQNNQTALSTPVREQSAVRVFADKAIGYGIPCVTIDGTDPDAIAAAFTWAAERAREGHGPALIELVAMRMCGHAHHDDMLYLGKDPQPSWTYPALTDAGYADRELYDFWCRRDPLVTYAARLEAEGLITADDVARFKADAEALVDREARAVIEAPWPSAELAGKDVHSDGERRVHIEVLDDAQRRAETPLPEVDAGPPFDAKGKTFLEAVMLGVGDALRNDPRTFVYGEDVGGKYGNAFLLLRPLLKDFGDRIMNSVLAEGSTIGVCIGAALAGKRPIGEIQFNDFIATGFNQLVNNAAKIHYRWGESVPFVLRMPWGGLRHAGPYHSQNTEAWFYRTPGLKIVAPSTPHDARALMAAAVADPDPVLYYEHIALYRDPRIKQALAEEAPSPIPLGRAALRRSGKDLGIISYGAFVHVAMRVAEALARDGIEAAVLDLRSLAPLDRDAVLAVARHTSRVLIIEEDTRTGSIGESLAAIIQEEAFEYLDAPVRVIGALDTPVPYSPPLEQEFLPSEEQIERAARLLVRW
ncbi:MAG TPA: thiamine pyrophosphate-dependent enzyme [Thermoanaerobaculia bacterium]|jgi:2-oxoisovalerate dehydrogenase E1 component|nr:thiamine pyrophosphate-dependent enzyme [Thermoanaerobaculia bacterium]